MIKNISLVALLVFVFSLFAPLLAETDEKSDNSNGGIKEIRAGFQVFPAGKKGNTLYKDKEKIFSQEDLTLIDVEETIDGHIYYGVNEADEAVLGFAGSDTSTFSKLDGDYYQLVTADGKRKLYRLNKDREIQNLLPRSNTANGLVFNGEDKAAFFHITKGETVEDEEGNQKYQYTFRIHVVKAAENRVVHLPETVNDFRSKLQLNWIDNNTLQYILSDDREESIVID